MIRVNKEFITKTLTFIANSIFINIFAKVFGMSNTMIAVSIVVIALTLVTIDLKEDIYRKTFWISMSIVLLGIGASLALVNPIIGLIVNSILIFFIVYATMDNYKVPMYFPFILSYIFMLMSSPINLQQLPLRIASIIIGSIYVVLVQLVLNKNRFSKTMSGTRKGMIFSIKQQIDNILQGTYDNNFDEEIDALVNTKVKSIYDTRIKYKYITNENKRNLEICLFLQNLSKKLSVFKNEKTIDEEEQNFLLEIKSLIELLDKYFDEDYRSEAIEKLELDISKNSKNKKIKSIYQTINHVECCVALSKLNSYDIAWKKDLLITNAMKKIDINSLAFKFALKLSLSISISIFLINIFNLEYGRWIIFPMISIIQPYYDETKTKALNRIIGTVLGVIMFTVIFAIIKDNAIRMNITILAAYIGIFVKNYKHSTAIVAISALGSAAMSGGGIEILVNRFIFTVIGCGIAMLINKYILHYKISDSIDDLKIEYKNKLKKLKKINKTQETETKRYNLILDTKLMEYKIGLYSKCERQ